MKGFIAVGVIGVGLAWGASAFLDEGIKGCIPDGDGAVNVVKDDGTIINSSEWKISNDGNTCYASNGGSTPPEILPVLANN